MEENKTSPLLEMMKGMVDKPMSAMAPAFTKWLNGTLKKAEYGSLEMEFVVREEMCNPLGIIHGGVSAAIIDEMIGMTLASLGADTYYLSINLHVDFISKAKKDETIKSVTRLVRMGDKVANLECEIYNSMGQLVAKGVSNLVNTGRKRLF
jgi:uncharacterized protein (TIGR00369 family)